MEIGERKGLGWRSDDIAEERAARGRKAEAVILVG